MNQSFNTSHMTKYMNMGTTNATQRKVSNTHTKSHTSYFENKISKNGQKYIFLNRRYRKDLNNGKHFNLNQKNGILSELPQHIIISSEYVSNIDYDTATLWFTKQDDSMSLSFSEHQCNVINIKYFHHFKDRMVEYQDIDLEKHIHISNFDDIAKYIHSCITLSIQSKQIKYVHDMEKNIGLDKDRDTIYMTSGVNINLEDSQYNLTFGGLSEIDVELAYSYIRGFLIQ